MEMITNYSYVFDTNGNVIQVIQNTQESMQSVVLSGLWHGFEFCAFLFGLWAVKSIWKSFLGGDSQSD